MYSQIGHQQENSNEERTMLATSHMYPLAPAMLLGLPDPNDGPLFAIRPTGLGRDAAPLRCYRRDLYGQMRRNGVTFTAFDAMTAHSLPRSAPSRRLSDRSRYSPRTCFAKGNA